MPLEWKLVRIGYSRTLASERPLGAIENGMAKDSRPYRDPANAVPRLKQDV